MNHVDLESWARRAAEELRGYVAAAEEAGFRQPDATVLLTEYDDIVAGRPTWQARIGASSEHVEFACFD